MLIVFVRFPGVTTSREEPPRSLREPLRGLGGFGCIGRLRRPRGGWSGGAVFVGVGDGATQSSARGPVDDLSFSGSWLARYGSGDHSGLGADVAPHPCHPR